MTQVALAWLLKKGIASPIIGASKVERIDEAVGVRGKELSEEEARGLEEGYQVRGIFGHS